MKFHIKDNGEPGVCKAEQGKCPLGSKNPHFSTKQEARQHYEQQQKTFTSTRKDSTISADDFTKSDVFQEIKEKKEYDRYRGTVFEDLKNLSSKAKGAFFEKIVEEYFRKKSILVEKSSNTDCDRIIDGIKTEIKGSFLWDTKKDMFRWQQIRTNQDYDVIVFLAVYPDEIKLFATTKEECKEFLEKQDAEGNFVHNQHGGKKVNSGTFFMDGMPEDFPFLRSIDRFF